MDRSCAWRIFSWSSLWRCVERWSHSVQVGYSLSSSSFCSLWSRSFRADWWINFNRMRFQNLLHRVALSNYGKIFLCFVSDRQEARSVHFRFPSWLENAARAYGLTDPELFQTIDLFEKRNIAQVTQCIFALGRNVSDGIAGNHHSSTSIVLSLGSEKEIQWACSRSENVWIECSRVHGRPITGWTKHLGFIDWRHVKRCESIGPKLWLDTSYLNSPSCIRSCMD